MNVSKNPQAYLAKRWGDFVGLQGVRGGVVALRSNQIVAGSWSAVYEENAGAIHPWAMRVVNDCTLSPRELAENLRDSIWSNLDGVTKFRRALYEVNRFSNGGAGLGPLILLDPLLAPLCAGMAGGLAVPVLLAGLPAAGDVAGVNPDWRRFVGGSIGGGFDALLIIAGGAGILAGYDRGWVLSWGGVAGLLNDAFGGRLPVSGRLLAAWRPVSYRLDDPSAAPAALDDSTFDYLSSRLLLADLPIIEARLNDEGVQNV